MSVDMYVSSSREQASSVTAASKTYQSGFQQTLTAIQAIVQDQVLKADAYTNAKSFYEAVLIPLVKGGVLLTEAVDEACQKFPDEYAAQVDSGDLKQSELEEAIQQIEQQIQDLRAIQQDLLSSDASAIIKIAQVMKNSTLMGIYQEAKRKLEEKLEKLLLFHASSPSIFSEISQLEQAINQGISQANQSWDGTTQSFVLPKAENMTWAKKINDSWKGKEHPPVWGEAGSYGADQGRLERLWKNGTKAEKNRIRALVKNILGQDATDDEIASYLSDLNYEGCGYAAAVNIILLKYQGKPDQFESDYGMSYYDADGNVNFDELLLAFYSTEDDMRDLPFTTNQFWFPHPGVLAGDLQSNIQHFSKEHGNEISGDYNIIYSESEIREQLSDGKIITMTCLASKMTLVAPDGADYNNQESRMHTVVITGYDERVGKFVVSSWGNKYYLDSLPGIADMYVY